jgi:hypothetical protein
MHLSHGKTNSEKPIRMNKKKWTKQTCIVDASKYKTRGQWLTHSQSSYQTARRNAWLEECCKHMIKNKKSMRTMGDCVLEARKHTSLNQWRKKHPPTYQVAVRMNWLEEITNIVWGGKTRVFWTLEMCIADAKQYKTRAEWHAKSRKSYRAALKNNWPISFN